MALAVTQITKPQVTLHGSRKSALRPKVCIFSSPLDYVDAVGPGNTL